MDLILHGLQVLRVHNAPEGVPGKGPELPHVAALEDVQYPSAGADDFLPAARAVKQDAAGQQVKRPQNQLEVPYAGGGSRSVCPPFSITRSISSWLASACLNNSKIRSIS